MHLCVLNACSKSLISNRFKLYSAASKVGSNTCVAQKMLFLCLVFFAISNVFFAASLVNEKMMLVFGSLSMSEMLMVLNPSFEHSWRNSSESAIIEGSS